MNYVLIDICLPQILFNYFFSFINYEISIFNLKFHFIFEFYRIFFKFNFNDSQLEINATEAEIKTNRVVSSRNVIIIIGEDLQKDYINGILKDYCKVVSL